MKKALSLIIVLISTFNLNATIWYVDLNASGANDGSSWTDAFIDLQDAIAISSFGDDIWVAQGIYYTTSSTSQTIYFNIKNGTKVYGGFAGFETALNQRDFQNNVTTLSAQIGTGSTSDNSLHVVYFNNVANQTRLDGFTLTGAYNDGTFSYGGGARIIDSSPTIANCIFLGNYAAEGGGGLNHSGSGILNLENCVFDGNVGDTYGGGALRLYDATVNISDCYFKSNQSDTYGGAIFIYDAIVNISNSVFAGNISQTSGSAIRVGDIGTLNVSNSLFVGNFTNTTSVITASTFSNTSAHTIKNCTIAHNKQNNSGGSSTASAVALNDEATITNSIIYGNLSTIQVLGTGLTFNYSITQDVPLNATGSNILYVDPQFILPGDANTAPFDTTGLDYQLELLSPGIDAGYNVNVSGTNDLAGNTRILNGTVDLGAYEKSFCNSPVLIDADPSLTICSGSPVTLTIIGGVQYQWSNGSTNSAITVSSAGNYSVVFEDTAGCLGNLQATVVSSVNPAPTLTYAAGSLTTGSFSSYQWYLNGNPVSGANSSSHNPGLNYGTYTVEVTNSSGCTGSEDYCFSPVSFSAGGPTTFCAGDMVTLSVANGDSFLWSNSSTNSSIVVTTSGNYSVTAYSLIANCSVNFQQSVTVNSNPTPTVSYNSGLFETQTYSSYQWYFNGNPISGATFITLIPTQGTGQYYVVVTDANGCNGTSNAFNYFVGIDEFSLESFSIYPNPVNEYIDLSFSGIVFESAEIFNASGQLILLVKPNDFQLEVSELNSGIYLLVLKTENQIYSTKFLKN
ncbi:MAG: T9SS type A sorting domain-containing protein [Crocinitomicaceae bacterium]|nr:T9SS type A sorting domain-containing protein [Crocinitomicaceae bacterium]